MDMIHGLPILLNLRQQGYKPNAVWLSTGVPYLPPKFKEEFELLQLVASGSVTTDDFRAFKGLRVTMFVPNWTDLAADCFEKLKLHAAEITCLCLEYGEDIGFMWSKKYGTLDLGLIGWLEKYDDARKRLCHTDAETKKRVADEQEAISHLPMHPDQYRGDA